MHHDEVFSRKIRAGKRTYIFDVRETRGEDYYVTITERKRQADGSFHKQKIFLYKEDFIKFLRGLNEAVDHIREDLLPDFDYSQYDRDEDVLD